MPKKLQSSHANNAHASKPDRPQKSDKKNQLKKGSSHREKPRGKKMGKGDQEMPEIIKKIGVGAKSRSGCFPKLFVLLLPFVVLGTYLFLRS